MNLNFVDKIMSISMVCFILLLWVNVAPTFGILQFYNEYFSGNAVIYAPNNSSRCLCARRVMSLFNFLHLILNMGNTSSEMQYHYRTLIPMPRRLCD